MTLLLDAHAFLWWVFEDRRLSRQARAAIAENPCLVSASTVWEIAIKRAAGKLAAPEDLVAALVREGFEELAVTAAHGDAAGALPPHHRDPFDRMLVAQAFAEKLAVVTVDPAFTAYGVPVVW
ncbi:MAG: type II toxin-antitoxin system VapC family toxin [Solirubrobacteraceae bacterium]